MHCCHKNACLFEALSEQLSSLTLFFLPPNERREPEFVLMKSEKEYDRTNFGVYAFTLLALCNTKWDYQFASACEQMSALTLANAFAGYLFLKNERRTMNAKERKRDSNAYTLYFAPKREKLLYFFFFRVKRRKKDLNLCQRVAFRFIAVEASMKSVYSTSSAARLLSLLCVSVLWRVFVEAFNRASWVEHTRRTIAAYWR